METIPACTECAACCCNKDPKWIEVTEADATQIDPAMLQLGDRERWAMRQHLDGRCIALNGKLCSIYPTRPEVCRVVQPGSRICLDSLGLLRCPASLGLGDCFVRNPHG